ncbi:MAG TPA: energy coupling factor transporter S component ThiW [Candidatus Bathyarchaeia archaeon]|nr:energy coupling factor transporter S component ThiW [Candidatus Bathyarchaeia archaeon]
MQHSTDATIGRMKKSRRQIITTKVTLSSFFIALGFVLSLVSFPIGPTRIFPFQHMINVIVAIMLGPFCAAAIALGIGTLRVAAGTGTLFAYPGGMPGGFVVGVIYWYLWHHDECALTEPLGTAVGGILSALAVAPFIGAKPLPPILGLTAQWEIFVIAFWFASIPGSIMGYVVVKALRKIGVFERLAF